MNRLADGEALQKYKWIEKQEAKLLPCPYFHVVFTIPHLLNDINLAFPKELYNILFRATWDTLNAFGWNHKYLGAQIGASMILHTWGSNLSYHPHIHCIVPAGGVTISGKWKNIHTKGKFLFPVKALSALFRGKYLAYLDSFMSENGMDISTLKKELFSKNWTVYAKHTPNNTHHIIGYLARYTHQIAIHPSRIKKYNNEKVTFSYTDYRHANQKKQMKLNSWEFVRRISLHILPHGFTRIRHFGILGSKWQKDIFPDGFIISEKWIRFWVEWQTKCESCPKCKIGRLIPISVIPPQRGPPSSTSNQKPTTTRPKILVP